MCGSRWPGLQDAGAAVDRRSANGAVRLHEAARRDVVAAPARRSARTATRSRPTRTPSRGPSARRTTGRSARRDKRRRRAPPSATAREPDRATRTAPAAAARCRRGRDLRRQSREDREQEGGGVGVDQHDVDEIGAHDQDVLLELRQQDQHHDHDERQRRRDGRTAQQQEPERSSAGPRSAGRRAGRRGRPRCEAGRPTAARCSSASTPMPKRWRSTGREGQPGTTEKSERGRHVTGAAPGLDTFTAGGGPLSSFCNKRGNARAETPRGAGEQTNKVKAGEA